MSLQPAFAGRHAILYMAWNNSTSSIFGDPNGSSNILFMRSDDGGDTSPPVTVNPPGTTDTQHVLPSLAIDNNPHSAHISYYTQHSSGTIDLDMANSRDRGATFPANRTVRVTSTSFNLPPSNVPLGGAPTFPATNYDRQIAVCYALGEHQSVTTAKGSVYVGWGDMRNTIMQPVNTLDPISGETHQRRMSFSKR